MAVALKDKFVTVEGLGVILGKDASGEDVESTYVKKTDISNDLTTTSSGKALDARQGKALKDMINGLTPADIGLGNVENKSSATIRGELTGSDVVSALGYTPPAIGKTIDDCAAGDSIIADSTARIITAGTSSAYSIPNLTADHIVCCWRFSGNYSDSNPPGDITVVTSNGSYTITAANLLASGITMQPVFIKP